MGTSQAKNNMKKTRKTKDSHLQARRNDDGVEDEEQMKNKEEEAPRITMVLSVSNGQRGGEGGPINWSFSTGSGQKPVLKDYPLAPVFVPNRC